MGEERGVRRQGGGGSGQGAANGKCEDGTPPPPPQTTLRRPQVPQLGGRRGRGRGGRNRGSERRVARLWHPSATREQRGRWKISERSAPAAPLARRFFRDPDRRFFGRGTATATAPSRSATAAACAASRCLATFRLPVGAFFLRHGGAAPPSEEEEAGGLLSPGGALKLQRPPAPPCLYPRVQPGVRSHTSGRTALCPPPRPPYCVCMRLALHLCACGGVWWTGQGRWSAAEVSGLLWPALCLAPAGSTARGGNSLPLVGNP